MKMLLLRSVRRYYIHRTADVPKYWRSSPVCLYKLQLCLRAVLGRKHSTGTGAAIPVLGGDPDLMECSEAAREDSRTFVVVPNFITAEEEQVLLQDISRTLRGKRYQYEHWDGAIEGYRETEKSQWREENLPLIERLKTATVSAVSSSGGKPTPLHEVHVLDLAKDGYIKPHIDSVKYCGEVIAGISLLSPSVMKLQHEEDSSKWICTLLPRLSLYIMHGVVRFKYTHAILSNEESFFKGQAVPRDRRISVICRTTPED